MKTGLIVDVYGEVGEHVYLKHESYTLIDGEISGHLNRMKIAQKSTLFGAKSSESLTSTLFPPLSRINRPCSGASSSIPAIHASVKSAIILLQFMIGWSKIRP
jgi:hypothetical protein